MHSEVTVMNFKSDKKCVHANGKTILNEIFSLVKNSDPIPWNVNIIFFSKNKFSIQMKTVMGPTACN